MGDGILIKRMIDIQTTHVHRACVVPLEECELNSTTHKARLRESTLKVNCYARFSLSRYPPVCVCVPSALYRLQLLGLPRVPPVRAGCKRNRSTSSGKERKLSSRASELLFLNCLFEEIDDILVIKI